MKTQLDLEEAAIVEVTPAPEDYQNLIHGSEGNPGHLSPGVCCILFSQILTKLDISQLTVYKRNRT